MILKCINNLVSHIFTFSFATDNAVGRFFALTILILKRPAIFWNRRRNMTISRIRLLLKELMSQKLSPLDTAIQLNDLEVVKHFIEKKPENVDMIVTEKGSTLLHVSAYSGFE